MHKVSQDTDIWWHTHLYVYIAFFVECLYDGYPDEDVLMYFIIFVSH